MTLFYVPIIKVVFGHKESVNELIDIILKRLIHIKKHHVEHYMSKVFVKYNHIKNVISIFTIVLLW